jgi:hypothetical protein
MLLVERRHHKMPNNKVKIVQQALAAVKKSLPQAPKGMRVKAVVVVVKGVDGKRSRHRVTVGKGPSGMTFNVKALAGGKGKTKEAPATAPASGGK